MVAERSKVWCGPDSFFQDPLDIGSKPDVEHAIGLVEHDVHDIAQIQRVALDVIQHAAGSADHEVNSRCRRPDLALDGFTAEDAADGDLGAQREFLKLAHDLLSQFAGRRQDDALRPACAGFEHLDQRDAKRRCLARARLGLADHVESVECLGDQGRLNGSWRHILGLLEGLEHGSAQAHRMEPEWWVPLEHVGSINPPQKQSIRSSWNGGRGYGSRFLQVF